MEFCLIFFVIFFNTVSSQSLVSPCPRLFTYEPRIKDEPNRWFGRVTLLSNDTLYGVKLSIILDKPSIHLGNWFGEVHSKDNIEYLINNPNEIVESNIPRTLRFYVKYNTNVSPPQLTTFKLNGKTVCPEGVTMISPTTDIQWLISEEKLGTILLNNNIPKCGTTIINTTPFITEGEYARPGQWPWHAALYRIEGNKRKYICGGTLITERHILTAAHCTTLKQEGIPRNPEELVIVLGKYGFYVKGRNEQIFNISKVTVHSHYNSVNFFNDISILHLETTAQFTDFVRPCCLWEGDTSLDSIVGRTGTAVGWGRDQNNNEQTDLLMQASMPVVDTLTCIYAHREVFAHYTNPSNFCAGFRNGTSVCNGDSGGGLVFRENGANGTNSVWRIRGIVSNSVAKEGRVCDTNYFVIFTDVAKYLDWIKNVTSS